MKPREFSYGGMFVRKTPYVIACLCMLGFVAASAWLIVHGNDPQTRATGLRSLVGFALLFAFIAATPIFIRWALVVRIDTWGVYVPSRARAEKKNGLPWEQIAEVRVIHTQSRDAVALIAHNDAYLSPLMRRFGAFILPPVNVPASELKTAIEEYRAEIGGT